MRIFILFFLFCVADHALASRSIKPDTGELCERLMNQSFGNITLAEKARYMSDINKQVITLPSSNQRKLKELIKRKDKRSTALVLVQKWSRILKGIDSPLSDEHESLMHRELDTITGDNWDIKITSYSMLAQYYKKRYRQFLGKLNNSSIRMNLLLKLYQYKGERERHKFHYADLDTKRSLAALENMAINAECIRSISTDGEEMREQESRMDEAYNHAKDIYSRAEFATQEDRIFALKVLARLNNRNVRYIRDASTKANTIKEGIRYLDQLLIEQMWIADQAPSHESFTACIWTLEQILSPQMRRIMTQRSAKDYYTRLVTYRGKYYESIDSVDDIRKQGARLIKDFILLKKIHEDGIDMDSTAFEYFKSLVNLSYAHLKKLRNNSLLEARFATRVVEMLPIYSMLAERMPHSDDVAKKLLRRANKRIEKVRGDSGVGEGAAAAMEPVVIPERVGLDDIMKRIQDGDGVDGLCVDLAMTKDWLERQEYNYAFELYDLAEFYRHEGDQERYVNFLELAIQYDDSDPEGLYGESYYTKLRKEFELACVRNDMLCMLTILDRFCDQVLTGSPMYTNYRSLEFFNALIEKCGENATSDKFARAALMVHEEQENEYHHLSLQGKVHPSILVERQSSIEALGTMLGRAQSARASALPRQIRSLARADSSIFVLSDSGSGVDTLHGGLAGALIVPRLPRGCSHSQLAFSLSTDETLAESVISSSEE